MRSSDLFLAGPQNFPQREKFCSVFFLARPRTEYNWTPCPLGRKNVPLEQVPSRTRIYKSKFRGVAQSGLARLLREQEVGGSNPLAPTILNRRPHKRGIRGKRIFLPIGVLSFFAEGRGILRGKHRGAPLRSEG